MKKYNLFILLFALVFLFSSCGNNTKVGLIQTEPETTEMVSDSITSQSEYIGSDVYSTENFKATNDDKKISSGNEVKSDKIGDVTELQTSVNASVAESSILNDSKPEIKYVNISVSCINAVNYGIRNNPSFAEVIPENGIILADTSVEFSDNDTVIKALKNVLKSNKITYQITSGGYVKSIGGLSEFDCGSGSGWLYKVNGVFPDISCKSYALSQGDKIEFIYTCKSTDT